MVTIYERSCMGYRPLCIEVNGWSICLLYCEIGIIILILLQNKLLDKVGILNSWKDFIIHFVAYN